MPCDWHVLSYIHRKNENTESNNEWMITSLSAHQNKNEHNTST